MALPNITRQDIEEALGNTDLSKISDSDIEKIRREILLKKFSNKDVLRYQAGKKKDQLIQWGKDKLSNFGDRVVEAIPGYGMYQKYKGMKERMANAREEARSDYLSRFGISDSDNDIQKIEQDVDEISDDLSDTLPDALESGVDEILEELDFINTNLERIIQNQEDGIGSIITPSKNIVTDSSVDMTGVTSATDSGILLAESSNTLREKQISGTSESSVDVLRNLVGIEQNILDIAEDEQEDALEEDNEELDRDETIDKILNAVQETNRLHEAEYVESMKKEKEDDGDSPLFGMLSGFISSALPYLAGIAGITAAIYGLYKIIDNFGEKIGNAVGDFIKDIVPDAEKLGASDETIEKTALAAKKGATQEEIKTAAQYSAYGGSEAGYFEGMYEEEPSEKEITKENVLETARTSENESTISSQKLKEKTSELKESESEAGSPVIIDASRNTSQNPQQGQQMNQNVFSTRNPNSSYTNMSMGATNYPQNR